MEPDVVLVVQGSGWKVESSDPTLGKYRFIHAVLYIVPHVHVSKNTLEFLLYAPADVFCPL